MVQLARFVCVCVCARARVCVCVCVFFSSFFSKYCWYCLINWVSDAGLPLEAWPICHVKSEQRLTWTSVGGLWIFQASRCDVCRRTCSACDMSCCVPRCDNFSLPCSVFSPLPQGIRHLFFDAAIHRGRTSPGQAGASTAVSKLGDAHVMQVILHSSK